MHPHVHCVVPAGGFAADQKRWIHPKYAFFLPVDVLSYVFREKFLAGLKQAYRRGRLQPSVSVAQLSNKRRFLSFVNSLARQKWVVYAKPAFGGPTQVIRYLARYTHRVAISNHRLLAFDGENVTFRWKDYAHGNKQRKMTVSANEFLRRFTQHILPRGFVRIRQFGYLTNTRRAASLTLARELLDANSEPHRNAPSQIDAPAVWHCPRCDGEMRIGPNLSAQELKSLCRRLDSS
ncbi:MAG TPA: transposase [Bryobacteraceae bacterium]|nr:transposase [Bryobacteraceae bacterium]